MDNVKVWFDLALNRSPVGPMAGAGLGLDRHINVDYYSYYYPSKRGAL